MNNRVESLAAPCKSQRRSDPTLPVRNSVDGLVHEQRQEQSSLDHLPVPERKIWWGMSGALRSGARNAGIGGRGQ